MQEISSEYQSLSSSDPPFVKVSSDRLLDFREGSVEAHLGKDPSSCCQDYFEGLLFAGRQAASQVFICISEITKIEPRGKAE